ncbi:MAG: discoidin domain-containing protein [Myxococcota bacterium]|nr:discoidin domain-containing protein [Myxococcota bacterium]
MTEPAVKQQVKARGLLRRVLDWLTLSSRLSEARELERRDPKPVLFLARARRAVRAADRLLDSPHALDREPELALELYAQAAHWLERVGQLDAPSEALARAFAEPFHERAERPPEELERLARDSQRWLRARLERAHDRLSAVSELRTLRAFRLYPALALLLGLLVGTAVLVVRAARGPDLAAFKPWRASSALFECNPAARQCGGANTGIFFHTRDEQEPWLEIDLQSIQRIGRVEVQNRRDGGGERAVPLIIEVSTDGKSYRKVAERTQLFDAWVATFEPTEARFVRLRVPRKTILHLERVSVRK